MSGKVAYDAYHTGGKSLATGHPIPEWDALPEEIREAWDVAAIAIHRCGEKGKRTPLYVKLEGVEMANIHDTFRASGILGTGKPGMMVAIRPCAEEHGGKTFLGMYLADAPTGVIGRQEGDKIVLEMGQHTNPAIYVPDLDKIVWGYGSWWGKILSEKHLRSITDEDIQSTWYVRALKQLASNVEGTDP